MPTAAHTTCSGGPRGKSPEACASRGAVDTEGSTYAGHIWTVFDSGGGGRDGECQRVLRLRWGPFGRISKAFVLTTRHHRLLLRTSTTETATCICMTLLAESRRINPSDQKLHSSLVDLGLALVFRTCRENRCQTRVFLEGSSIFFSVRCRASMSQMNRGSLMNLALACEPHSRVVFRPRAFPSKSRICSRFSSHKLCTRLTAFCCP